MIDSINDIETGVKNAAPQSEEGVTYAHKLSRHETAIDWQQNATAIVSKIQAFNSANIATMSIGEKRIKVWTAEVSDVSSNAEAGTVTSLANKKIHIRCGDGSVALTQLQMPGGKALASRDILNGHAKLFAEGTVISENA